MIPPATKADQVLHQLRSQIISGQFEPGERLDPTALAKQFLVSRNTVAKALRNLGVEGLIKEDSAGRTFVAKFDERDVEELFDLRSAIEIKALELARNRDLDRLITALTDVLTRMEHAVREKDRDALARLDFEFHEQIYVISDNSRIQDVFSMVTPPLRMLMALEEHSYHPDFDAVVTEHRAILNAIRDPDPEVAVTKISSHLEGAKARLMRQGHAARHTGS